MRAMIKQTRSAWDIQVTLNARELLRKRAEEEREQGRELTLRKVAQRMAPFLYDPDSKGFADKDSGILATLRGYVGEGLEEEELHLKPASWRLNWLEAFALALDADPNDLLRPDYRPSQVDADALVMLASALREKDAKTRGFVKVLSSVLLRRHLHGYLSELLSTLLESDPSKRLRLFTAARDVPEADRKRF